MINSSTDSVKKLNLINRRMFITGSLKFLVMVGLVSRLFFLHPHPSAILWAPFPPALTVFRFFAYRIAIHCA